MADPSSASSFVERLLEVFERQNADGTFYFSDGQVRALLPALVLAGPLGSRSGRWPPQTRALMDEFGALVSLPASASVEALRTAALSYYAANPPDAELVALVLAFLRREGGLDADALEAILGTGAGAGAGASASPAPLATASTPA